MHWLNHNAGGIQALATLVLVAVTGGYVWLTFRQARAAERQVEATRRASQAQAVLEVVGFLQSEPVREARTLIRSLDPGSSANWTDDEKRAAATVCASFDVIAMLVTHELIEDEPFTTNWGVTLVQCYRICRSYIAEIRAGGAGPTYWQNFESAATDASQKLNMPLTLCEDH